MPPTSSRQSVPVKARGEPPEADEARPVRRRRAIAAGALVFAGAAVALVIVIATAGGGAHVKRSPTAAGVGRGTGAQAGSARESATRPFAVGLQVLHLVDHTRTMTLPSGTSQPRTLVTYVRYPALGRPGQTDLPNAPPASADGPFPLVVFGHGFALTPALYELLLQSWVRAGYVVAAPVFPLENADAPGGPEESDLTNQPADMSFVISSLLATKAGPLAGLVDAREVAVAGQSDGGDTALASAYDPAYRDRRVKAAVILSGAEIPGTPAFGFPPSGPPLLATQGTADTINLPSATYTFYEAAHRPKFLLRLLGAEHLGPYSNKQPQLGIVERVTTAFFDNYLKHQTVALARLALAGNVPRIALLTSEP